MVASNTGKIMEPQNHSVANAIVKRKPHCSRRTSKFAESFGEPSGKGASEMCHLFLFVLFVGTHFRFCKQMICPLAYCVLI